MVIPTPMDVSTIQPLYLHLTEYHRRRSRNIAKSAFHLVFPFSITFLILIFQRTVFYLGGIVTVEVWSFTMYSNAKYGPQKKFSDIPSDIINLAAYLKLLVE